MTFEEKLAAAAATFKDSRQMPAQPGDRSVRLEPTFSDFDDEDLEEPERDTDYAAAYEEDDAGDDDIFGDRPDEEDDLFAGTPDEDDDTQGLIPPPDIPRRAAGLSVARPAVTDDPDLDDPDLEEDEGPDARDGEPYDEYEEDEAYDDEYDDSYEDAGAGHRGRWPLGLIAVALLALLLLAAGGYGVVQERFAMQEQISQLDAALAAAGQVQETGSGEDLRALERLSEERARTIEALTVENRRLTDMVAGLESQLEAQNLSQAPVQGQAAPKPAPVAPEVQARPAATAKPAATKAATATPPVTTRPSPTPPAAASTAGSAGGDWFVNFGSYSQSAVAETWASRLKPAAGKVVVTSADRDGASFYRVRIIDLADRAAAEKVSRQLETQYGLPKLWVGRE